MALSLSRDCDMARKQPVRVPPLGCLGNRERGRGRMSARAAITRTARFCWVDLATPDLDASAKFYGELMGWEFEPGEAGAEGVDVGATATSPIGASRSRGWGGSCRRASRRPGQLREDERRGRDRGESEGGRGTVLMGPMDIPGGAGRMTVCQDAERALICPGSREVTTGGARQRGRSGPGTTRPAGTRTPPPSWTAAVRGGPGSPGGRARLHLELAARRQRWPEGLAGLMWRWAANCPGGRVRLLAGLPGGGEARRGDREDQRSGRQDGLRPQETPVARFATVFDPQGAVVSLIERDYPSRANQASNRTFLPRERRHVAELLGNPANCECVRHAGLPRIA